MKLNFNPKNLTKKQRVIAISVASCLLIAITLGVLWAALWRAPHVDDIYDRVVELIESSYEINTVFLGAGLPVYPNDSKYAELNHLYFDNQYDDYEIVTKAESVLKDKGQLILVYCRSGRRSKLAAEELVKLGYTNVKEFGGIIDWPYETV